LRGAEGLAAVPTTDVVVIGAGQAGLATSYLLRRREVDHIVLERGAVGESWRSQRWDSFCLNTPNWANGLPGKSFGPDRPDAFSDRNELVSYFEDYVTSFALPVQSHTPVKRVEPSSSGRYTVDTDNGTVHARAVVLASGGMSRPRVPPMAERLPGNVASMSAGAYRNADALPAGSAVVVGSGQSGCQIAEDLLAAGRRVYLSASRVARVPRAYRGRDILAWWRDMGFFEVTPEELEDPSVQFAAQPQVSGAGGGHTVSLQSLARDGATLLGRVSDIDQRRLRLADTLRSSIAFADEKADSFKTAINAWIDREGIEAAAPEPDPGEPPLPDLDGSDRMRSLDLASEHVGAVIWCTGFDADWSWVKADVFDERGRPRHRRGITDAPGLYFLGFPWLSKRKSGILYGVTEDAERVVEHLGKHVLARDALE
jgi:putative flavoprotein involved in K+ transport